MSNVLTEIDSQYPYMTKNEKKIAEYIRTQLQSDIVDDQMTLKEYIDPFTGRKMK